MQRPKTKASADAVNITGPSALSDKVKSKGAMAPTAASPSSSSASAASAAGNGNGDGNKLPSSGVGPEDLETQVKFLQRMLEGDGGDVKNAKAALAMNVLTSLARMTLTVEIFKSTGVGRVVNKLKKHTDEQVAKSAAHLVAKWKKDTRG